MMGIEQLKRAVSFLKSNVQCTLVFGSDVEPYFIALDVTNVVYNNAPIRSFEDDLINFRHDTIIDYKNLILGVEPKILIRKQQKKQERIDRMKIFCWLILPLLAIALLILDQLSIFALTTERLIIFGVSIIVILLPFFSEISIKEFTLKRDSNPKEKK